MGAKPAAGRDAELKAKVQELRRTDNLTNWYYLARTYLFLAMVIAGAVAFAGWRQSAGLPWLVSLPIFALAIVLVGVGQHHLSGLAHEGSHYVLFRNRELNELASDLLCMFPLFSSTYHYRLQHLAHHQFVNDPQRDPDVAQLEASGHRLAFPLERGAAWRALARQLRPAGLARYLKARAAHAAAGGAANPYAKAQSRHSGVAKRVAGVALLAQFVAVGACVAAGSRLGLALIPLAIYCAAAIIFLVLPPSCYMASRLHPVIGLRWLAALRVGYMTAIVNALGWAQLETGRWAVGYFALLWLVPLTTSFAYFMLLRQTVQHGNGDGGWLTNTRVFFVHDMMRLAVFPVGQDYHLPHHLYATVPHYRLRRLHAALLADPDYRAQALEVHGTYSAPHREETRPTILDVLGPDYAPRGLATQHVDDSVLDDCVVEDRATIGRRAA